MAPDVVEAVEIVLNRLTDGLHETTRLNKRKVNDIAINPASLATLTELGIDTSFLEAFDPNSPACKKATFIDKTLKEAAQLMITINNGRLNIAVGHVIDGFCIEILAENLPEEQRAQIKQKVALLNSMLKKMIPLYGAQGVARQTTRADDTPKQEPPPHYTQRVLVIKDEAAD